MRGFFGLDDAPIWIPWQYLTPEALEQVVATHLAAQVGDMNVADFDFDEVVTKVLAEVKQDVWRLVLDPKTETVVLVAAEDYSGEDEV